MRPRQVPLTIVLLLLTLTSLAQKGKIEGKITDSKTGNKLSGVSISIDTCTCYNDLFIKQRITFS